MVARWLIALGVLAVRALPRAVAEAVAAGVGAFAWAAGIRRKVAIDNVRHAFPQHDEAAVGAIARAAYQSMARALMESLRSDLLTSAELQQAVVVDDWRGLDTLLAARQPVLIASAHLGSWELLGEVMARRGHPISAVVRPLSGAFNEWLFRSRERAGIELIMQRGALRGMTGALKRGRPVVQLIDQALPSRGAVWVPFLGRPASTSPALSIAALRTKAPVYVVLSVRRGGRHHMVVEGPIAFDPTGSRAMQIRTHVAEVTAVIERYVRQYPEQWLWLHRRWKGVPESIVAGVSPKESA